MSGKKWLLQLRTYVNVKSSWSWKQNLNSRYYVNVKSRRGWRQKHRTVFYHSMIAFEWYLVLYRNLNLTPGWLQIKGLTWTHLISHCCQQSGIDLSQKLILIFVCIAYMTDMLYKLNIRNFCCSVCWNYEVCHK